ncbi:LysR family transcriptional regulator [Virgibacillus halodenitrificans]|jgi:LysR family transcriptional regulator, transcriptional activator of the cysJI operon|uniref:LysR family transcriptional regulator n=1 Tax=Virgibacillus halodenitrificans TaxID=1482 RepID=A0AAC9NJE4_VIRHA|nr:LysR family transcriptional regulator [Virgibacillus halodenitrificans]APC46958.1 LysR family transcriptional regulator [Virgibacillus halodenitrificans]MCG1027445.1 LysR family transcriptional regulator [Virgibacillus halodenitrificans]MYL47773.1 LysR family transcriptional regulator [Virgibacillus halodenitrificans]CDQ37155.1 CysJI operon transcriptional activator [Virgibacillus halodenitrificans]
MDQHLKIFLTVAEMQNFSRAAEEHHMTQPAVSQYIRTFEEMIGTRLLERNNKYVRLNKAGEIVYHHGKEILGLYTKMQNLVDDLTNKASGRLYIGASYTFGEYVLPRIISNLQDIYPDIHPEITIGNTTKISDLVATNQLDVGIVEGQFIDKKLIAEELAEDAMVVVASVNHPLAKKKGEIVRADLQRETWVVREEGSGTREATEKVFRQFHLSPEKLMNFSSTQLIKESVEVGLGISLLSQWTIQKELKNDDLKILDVAGLPLQRKFSIVTNSRFQTKALEVFLSILRKNKLLMTL